jgi:hypothetical protein
MKLTIKNLSFLAAVSANLILMAAPFNDGDVVVFFGDSITHGGFYHEYITDFYRTRYPEKSIRFINSGVGGDNANAAQRRIPDDVTPYNPTHVAIHFGMNDVSRGSYTADVSISKIANRVGAYERWKENINVLLGKLKESVPNAKHIYFTTTPYDDTAVVTNIPPGTKGWSTKNQIGCNVGLSMMAGHIANKAAADKVTYVDFYTPLNSFLVRHQKDDPHFMMTKYDRVHPLPLGHTIMAWKFLETQRVSPFVSDVLVDVKELKSVRRINAKVTDITGNENGVKFSILAKSLPFPVIPEALEYVKEFEVEKKLNREYLAVKGLSKGKYQLLIEGENVGEWSNEELEKGISLGFNSKTPQYRQAQEVLAKQAEVSAREREIRNCHYTRWFYQPKTDVDDVKAFSEWFEKNVKNKTMVFSKFKPQYVEYWPKHKEVREQLWKDQEAVRALAKPRQLSYEVKKVN